MRKILLILSIVWLVPGVIATAAPPDELTSLAQYYDDETVFFASVRTDDGFVDTLDRLLAEATPFLPEDSLPDDFSLRDTLEQGLQVNSVEYETVREWLGDTAAFGFDTDVFEDIGAAIPPIYGVVEVDSEAALAFFESLFQPFIDDEIATLESIGEYTVYESTRAQDPAYAFGNGIMMVGLLEAMPLDGVDSPLRDLDTFQSALTNLPEDDYNAFVYSDTGAINRTILEQASGFGMLAMPGSLLTNLSQTVGFQALGLTILDDTALTIDVVQSVNLSSFADLGIGTLYIPSAIDLDFASRVPADAPLVIMGSDFGASNLASFEQLHNLSEAIVADGGFASLIDPQGQLFSEQERTALRAIDPYGLIIGATNVSFAGLTGLSLERDVLPVLDGDSALYIRALPAEDFVSPVVPDFGVVIGTSDTAAAQGIVESFIAASEAYDAAYPVEAYGDGSALVLPLLSRFAEIDYAGLDIMIGAADGIFAFGTRPAVETTLDTSGGLATDAAFNAAQAYFLPDAQQVLYANLTPLITTIDELAVDGVVPINTDAAAARQFASIVESASITTTVSDNGLSTVRFVLSLTDEVTTFPDSVEIQPAMIDQIFEDIVDDLETAPTLPPTTIPNATPTATPGS